MQETFGLLHPDVRPGPRNTFFIYSMQPPASPSPPPPPLGMPRQPPYPPDPASPPPGAVYQTECASVGDGQAFYLSRHELKCPGIEAMSSVQLQTCYMKIPSSKPECQAHSITPESAAAGCYERGIMYVYKCDGINPVKRRFTDIITKQSDCVSYKATDAPTKGLALTDQKISCKTPFEQVPPHNALLSFKWESCSGWFSRYTYECAEVWSRGGRTMAAKCSQSDRLVRSRSNST